MDKDMAEGETGAHQGGRTRGGHPTGQKEEIEDSKRKMMYPVKENSGPSIVFDSSWESHGTHT